MKKTLLVIVIVLMLFLTGLSSAVTIKVSDIAQNKSKKEDSKHAYKIELSIPNEITPKSSGWYEFAQKHGIKIWACGYGTLSCKIIDEDLPFYEFTEGKKGDEAWKVHIWASQNQGEYYNTNSFKYYFYDDAAETKTSSLVTFPIPGFSILMIILAALDHPALEKNFRRNHKTPFIGTGPHNLSSGLFFNGTVIKGKTYDGLQKPDKMVDTNYDGVNDTICSYYEIIARSTSVYLVDSFNKEDIGEEEFRRIALWRYLFWKDPSYIPFDV